MDLTTTEYINQLLVYNADTYRRFHDNKWAFFLHVTVVEDFKKLWHKFFRNIEWNIFGYTLQIGGKYYDMRIIYVTLDSWTEELDILRKFIEHAQFSFPWRDNLNFFISVGSFNILEEFIKNNNLQPHILRIEEKCGITENDDKINVVTFKQSVNALKIFKKYKDHLSSIETYQRTQYYYMTHAFPWVQPFWMNHFKISLHNDEFYTVFSIILNHLGTLNYTNELNIFDLISISLALCDFRKPSASSLIKCEIDFMIGRELASIVKTNRLDLDQYTIDKNLAPKNLLMNYLVYEFQNHFEMVKRTRKYFLTPGLAVIRSTIKLVNETDVLNKLKQKCNVKFDIDGSRYDRMSLSLFLDLVECENVYKIALDTNYEWHPNVCSLNRSIANSYGTIEVDLIGRNTFNFIEAFVMSLKTITFIKEEIVLKINCNLINYTIFDNLPVEWIRLYDIGINRNMLNELHKSNLKSIIGVYNCTFESTRHNWALLNNLNKLKIAKIHENEGTFASLFEFILDKVLKSDSNEFRFDKIFFEVICDGNRRINFNELTFIIDELNSKLEIYSIKDNQFIDLYNLKFGLVPDNRSDYDFYQ